MVRLGGNGKSIIIGGEECRRQPFLGRCETNNICDNQQPDGVVAFDFDIKFADNNSKGGTYWHES